MFLFCVKINELFYKKEFLIMNEVPNEIKGWN